MNDGDALVGRAASGGTRFLSTAGEISQIKRAYHHYLHVVRIALRTADDVHCERCGQLRLSRTFGQEHERLVAMTNVDHKRTENFLASSAAPP